MRAYRSTTRDAGIAELSRAVASPFRFRLLSSAADPSTWEREINLRGRASRRHSPSGLRRSPTRSATCWPQGASQTSRCCSFSIANTRFTKAAFAKRFYSPGARSTRPSIGNMTTLSTRSWQKNGLKPGFLQGRRLRLEEEDECRFIPCQRYAPCSANRETSGSSSRSATINATVSFIVARIATEDDARRAIDVARRVVEIMSAL